MGKGDFSQALIEIIQIHAVLENIVGLASGLQTVTKIAVNMTKKKKSATVIEKSL